MRRLGVKRSRSAALGLLTVLALAAVWLGPGRAVAMNQEDAPADDIVSGAVDAAVEGEEAAAEPDETATPEADAVEETAPPPKLATIVFTTDTACNVLIGGISFGLLEVGQPLEVPVESLTLQASATAVDLPVAMWTEDLVLEPDEVRKIAIPMLETIEDQRKKERREQVFRDNDHGWMWCRRDNAADVSWSRAGAYCEGLDLGGFDNWRLPTLDELVTLESMWSLRALKIADQILLSACCLWSSTEGSNSNAWNLDFRFRRPFEISRSLSFGLRALCVREMVPEELAESRLAADPKERKRRLKEKRKRLDERKRRRAEKALAKPPTEPQEPQP